MLNRLVIHHHNMKEIWNCLEKKTKHSQKVEEKKTFLFVCLFFVLLFCLFVIIMFSSQVILI